MSTGTYRLGGKGYVAQGKGYGLEGTESEAEGKGYDKRYGLWAKST